MDILSNGQYKKKPNELSSVAHAAHHVPENSAQYALETCTKTRRNILLPPVFLPLCCRVAARPQGYQSERESQLPIAQKASSILGTQHREVKCASSDTEQPVHCSIKLNTSSSVQFSRYK